MLITRKRLHRLVNAIGSLSIMTQTRVLHILSVLIPGIFHHNSFARPPILASSATQSSRYDGLAVLCVLGGGRYVRQIYQPEISARDVSQRYQTEISARYVSQRYQPEISARDVSQRCQPEISARARNIKWLNNSLQPVISLGQLRSTQQ